MPLNNDKMASCEEGKGDERNGEEENRYPENSGRKDSTGGAIFSGLANCVIELRSLVRIL